MAVTNRVTADHLAAFLATMDTAALSYPDASGEVRIIPVAFSWNAGRPEVGLSPDRSSGPLSGTPVAVCADGGVAWWELRALLMRGTLTACAPPRGDERKLDWFSLAEPRSTAWDYDALHEDDSPVVPDNGALRTAEMRAWLRDSAIARVATRSPSGKPFITPLWFVSDGSRLFISTGANSVTVRNLRRDDRIALLIGPDGSQHADRLLRIEGRAAVAEGLHRWRVLAGMAGKYYLNRRGLLTEGRHLRRWGLRRRYYGQASPAAITVTPQTYEWIMMKERGR